MSPRVTRDGRERRFQQARKVEARIAFLDEPFRETIQATCAACNQRLGWWTNEDSPDWRTKPLIATRRAIPLLVGDDKPGEVFVYNYSGYPDTGYDVVVIHHDPGSRGQRPRRILSTGGLLSRGGQRIGRRPRTNDAYLNQAGFGIPDLTVGQIVTLPANVYCPVCDPDMLNAIPVPMPGEEAV